jgi:hypothetical protein
MSFLLQNQITGGLNTPAWGCDYQWEGGCGERAQEGKYDQTLCTHERRWKKDTIALKPFLEWGEDKGE